WIGRHYNGSDYHDGYMDELRYSKAARASAWRKATYHSLFDTLVFYSSVHDDLDGDGLTEFEETNIYGTDPNLADTDGDGINDGDELAYWGANWNNDHDGDRLNNLVDSDADNDHISDGDEIDRGYDPSDPGSIPLSATVSGDANLGLDLNEQQGGGGLVGDLVRILHGNMIESRNDVGFSSPHSLGLRLNAFYNSRSIVSGLLGHGWSHTFEAFFITGIQIDGQNTIRVMDETGRARFFADNGTDNYPGLLNEKSHMQYEADEYVWHRLDGSRHGFSAAGKLLWIEDEKGNELTLAYDAQGKLETVTDTASGRALTFNYVSGLLDHISGPVTSAVSNGIWVSYGYDGHQNLTSVTYADGSGFTYSYTDPNGNHNLTEKRNAANQLLGTWSYDAQDRCNAQSNPDGTDVTVVYATPTQADVTDAYGTVRSYTIAEVSGRKLVTAMTGLAAAPYDGSNLKRWQYDAQMNLIEVETAGGTIHQYQNHDARGNPGTVILAAGQPEERTITYTYHPDLNAPLTRSEPSVLGTGDKITTWDYDDDYNATPNENPANLPSRVIEQGFTKDATGATVAYEYITTLTYNAKGQLLTVDGPLTGTADTTGFGYDIATGNLLSITRPFVGSTGFTDYDDAGQMGRVTDVNSQSEIFTYDGRGRVTAVTHEADGSSRTVLYNSAGRPNTTTDEDDVSFSFDYDALSGRLVNKLDWDGNYIDYSYDGQGNLTGRSKCDAGDICTLVKNWDYQGAAIPGKLRKEIKPDGSFFEYLYHSDGSVSAVIDFNLNRTDYEYDALNRLIAVTQPGSLITSYDYDLHGNLQSVMDAQNQETTFTYDDMGRVVAITSPDTGTARFSYDAAGNLVQKTDAKAIEVSYDYDDLNRLTQITFPDSAQNITYSYDTGGNGIGRRTGMTDPAGSTRFGYDSRGRLVSKVSTVNSVAYSISRVYSPASRLSSMTYPSGRTVDLTRYSNNRKIQTVATTYNAATKILMDNMAYNPFGGPKAMDNGSGGSVDNQSGECGCLEKINPGAKMEQVYSYDNNGNLTNIAATNTPWLSQDFTYDALNRLETATGNYGSVSYTYDGVGNRLSKTIDAQADTYSYVPGTNRLDQIAGANPAAFSYDANGNITDIDSKTFIYNQNNRLIRVEEGLDILEEYTYNGLGQRQIKEVAGVATVFHYDFDGNIIAESLSDGTVTTEYLYMGSSRLAKVDVATGAMYFYLNNYLGTPILLTDDTGTVVWEAEYQSFGEAAVNPNSTVVNNFRFAGQYFDEETGLHYNWHRYYDPKTGRYLTPDPIGLLGGINLYFYAGANPINFTDPYGLFVREAWEYAKSGAVLVALYTGQAGIETLGALATVGEGAHSMAVRYKYERENIPGGYEIVDLAGSFLAAFPTELGELSFWGFELAAKGVEEGLSEMYPCTRDSLQSNQLSAYFQTQRIQFNDWSNLLKDDVFDFAAGRSMSNSPFRNARYVFSQAGTELKSHITDAFGRNIKNQVQLKRAIYRELTN
ncbi:Rhs family protein, partial [Olavius sp. associated proteobacterium Delta 1]